ncbi:hypothetical protein MKX42_30155 [Paenibacillus sp. FSL R7-0204]|uniref:hypothetical protein n=1 Tax=Paenibacillus sp. FSL R7-0204 TaxID=2921675 RepID=UPI0030F5DCDF
MSEWPFLFNGRKGFLAFAENKNMEFLCELLSSDKLLDTLVDNGLILPEGVEQNEYTENAVKTIVSDIVRGVVNEDHIPYNYTELAELARRILDVSSSKSSAKASYSLINSTVIGSWSNSYTGYNCYGYSIGVHVFQNPGYHSGQGFSMSLPIASMADLVVDDLNTLGYWGYKTTTKPSPLANYQKVVAKSFKMELFVPRIYHLDK